MLKTPRFTLTKDPQMALVLGAVSDGPLAPREVQPGYVRCGHWSPLHLASGKHDEWGDELPTDDMPCYGVCDSIEQFDKLFGSVLRADPRTYWVCFVEIKRENQPAEGGWRWHKWGDYVGERQPSCEYLHDEPHIDCVWTFHIYREIS